MGRRPLTKYAATKDAPPRPRREESALGTGRSMLVKLAVVRDAPKKSSTEECVTSMGQSAKLAVVRDVLTMCRREESA